MKIKERILMTVQEYSVLKERIKEHECGWSQCVERRSSLLHPGKPVLAELSRERRRDRAVVLDKLAIVARKAEEGAHSPNRPQPRPLRNCLHLGRVHGHPGG
jgi:hypothetical protein